MPELEIPFPLKGLPLKPEIKGRQKVEDVLIQSLACLLAWDGEGRRLLKCSLGGSLNSISPAIKGFYHETAAGVPVVITCSDIETSEVIIRGHQDNTGLVWVDVNTNPTDAKSWPLGANEWVKVSANNLNNIRLLMSVGSEKAIIAYSV